MSERKSINKYYPPDFDPSKIIKKKKKIKTGSASLPTSRLMTPFSMRCTSCGEFIAQRRKFNARKENTNETYLGLKIYRFHIKCPRCASEIAFRTDPKSADFIIEQGAKKNYDSTDRNKALNDETLEQTLSRLEKEEEEAKLKELEKDKKQTTLEELEAKLNDIQRQQEIGEELDEIQEKNKKLNQFSTQREAKDRLVEKNLQLEKLLDEQDEKLADEIFKSKPKINSTISKPLETFNEATESTNDDESTLQRSISNSGSDSDSDSDYDQPLTNVISQQKSNSKIVFKRKTNNNLGISIKKLKK